MELHEAIYRRRSVRHFTDQEVTSATVMALLDAAIQAPSALNQQPWVFGVFHGRKLLQDFSERAKRYLMATSHPLFETHTRTELYHDTSYSIFHHAGTLIVIYAAHGHLNPNEDCCLAAQNLMLAAHGLGLGTCPIGYARSWLDLPETKRQLGVPPDCTAVFPVVVGYPAAEPPPVPRRKAETVAWQWQAE